MKLAIIAAFPRELKYVRKRLNCAHEIVIAQSGMGMPSAERKLLSILQEYTPDCVLSIGFAGALFKKAVAGDLIWAEKTALFSDEYDFRKAIEIDDPDDLFKKISLKVRIKKGHIITLASRKRKQEIKANLHRALPCPVCDMETYALARLCKKRNMRFISVRAITDTLKEDISAPLFNLHDEMGKLKTGRLLSLISKNPASIKEMLRLGKNSRIAAKRLSEAVRILLEII